MRYFRRNGFNKPEFRNVKPKWHISTNPPDSEWGVWTALCGYTFNNILGGIINRSLIKDAKLICTRCAKLADNE